MRFGPSASASIRISHGSRGTAIWGRLWTWTAIDADTKLIVSYVCGGTRDAAVRRYLVLKDVVSRVSNRVQFTTDGSHMYANAVERVFGIECRLRDADKTVRSCSLQNAATAPAYASERKRMSSLAIPTLSTSAHRISSARTSPCACRCVASPVSPMDSPRRPTNHYAALGAALHHYNFCRVHTTLRVTPAMEAGLAHLSGVLKN